MYQYYNLEHLWYDIKLALQNDIKLINLVTEPIKISELYYELTGDMFHNEISDEFPRYNIETKYSALFMSTKPYLYNKAQVIEEIKRFVQRYKI